MQHPRVGVDAVDIGRLRKALARHPRLVARLFAEEELEYAQTRPDPVPHLAGRLAAKEAVGKILGGVGSWRDIVVLREGGRPRVELRGRAAQRATLLKIGSIDVSISHTDTIALAVAACIACKESGWSDARRKERCP